jgi:hypothetical protein
VRCSEGKREEDEKVDWEEEAKGEKEEEEEKVGKVSTFEL